MALRGLLLLGAVAGALSCLVREVTPRRAAFAAGCGLSWLWLSRRKVVSLDARLRPPRR